MARTERQIDRARLGPYSRMELVARQAVEGFLFGKHPSPFHGSSVEYADHRPYTLGDSLRSLDWKLLAKTDRHYVKLYEDQSNLRCTILLDTSASMGFVGDSERMDKLTYAAHLAAALGYLMLRQSDALGLALFDNRVRDYLPPRCTPAHYRRMLERLETTPTHEQSELAPVIHELAGRLKKRGLVIVISDLLDEPTTMLKALGHLRHRKHEVIVFHVLDPHEMSLPYDRLTRFKDIEGPATLIANPANVRGRYLERLQAFMNAVKAGCLERGISYELTVTDNEWDRLLRGYLARRSRMR